MHFGPDAVNLYPIPTWSKEWAAYREAEILWKCLQWKLRSELQDSTRGAPVFPDLMPRRNQFGISRP